MDKKFGYYVFLGLLIGAVFGLGLGSANGNTLFGIGGGALVGMFLGWFIAVAVLENGKKDNPILFLFALCGTLIHILLNGHYAQFLERYVEGSEAVSVAQPLGQSKTPPSAGESFLSVR